MGEEQQKAFEDIKQDVTKTPALLMPNSTGHFVLVSEAVANYSISELELTGIMTNVAAFKHLLRNANFHVYCDHSALVHIFESKKRATYSET